MTVQKMLKEYKEKLDLLRSQIKDQEGRKKMERRACKDRGEQPMEDADYVWELVALEGMQARELLLVQIVHDLEVLKEDRYGRLNGRAKRGNITLI